MKQLNFEDVQTKICSVPCMKVNYFEANFNHVHVSNECVNLAWSLVFYSL